MDLFEDEMMSDLLPEEEIPLPEEGDMPPEELMEEGTPEDMMEMPDTALLDEYRGMADPAAQEQEEILSRAEELAQAESVIDPEDKEMITRMRKLLQLRAMARDDAAKKFQQEAFNLNALTKSESQSE